MENKNQNPPATLLKASEVAESLNISKAFAYKLMNQGTIPSVQIGYAKRVRPQDLHEFIRNNLSSDIHC
ncbi:MAG: helix-turn-helix domain-containing protein [Anaerolineales bacterium]